MEGDSFSRNAPPPELPVNDDLALAKALQDQERAFALLATSATAATGSGTAAAATTTAGEGERRDEDEEGLDDEALAWKLHEQMEREHLMALAGILPGQDQQLADVVVGQGDGVDEEEDEEEGEAEEDPSSLSYERLTALTDVVGVVPKKASDSAISKVVVGPYVPRSRRGKESSDNGARGENGDGENKSDNEEEEEQCAVCRVELESGEESATLPCGHAYHEPCVLAWLERAKSCPVCNAELE